MLKLTIGLSTFICACLLSLSMPVPGFCQSAYEQLQDAAGHPPGAVPDPGEPVCVGDDCPQPNHESISAPANPTLAALLARNFRHERILVKNIQMADLTIEKCDARIASATAILAKARQTGNSAAEQVALQALNKVQTIKINSQQQKHRDEQRLLRVTQDQKNLTRALREGSAPADTRGVVSRSSGDVSLLRTNSGVKAKSLTNSAVPTLVYLSPGDEVRTGPDSQAEFQMLSGRGAVTMGENSHFRVEKDGTDTEVVRTEEGKFHFAVEKASAFEADLEQNLAALRDNLAQNASDSAQAYEQWIKGLRAKLQKKLQVRCQTAVLAVRGTEFLVTAGKDGRSELTVIEGSVEVSEPLSQKNVMVSTGQVIAISAEGTLTEVRPIDTAKLQRWWEEQR